jgi:O-antigen/teichoic acid export membrane protein
LNSVSKRAAALVSRKINLSRGRRGILDIATGTAAGQLLALLCAPILSRLYSPAEFGMYTVFFALASAGAAIAALRFELAIPIPKENSDVFGVVVLGLLSSVTVAALGTIALTVAAPSVSRVLAQPHVEPWLLLVPVTAAAMGAFGVLNQLAIRQHRYAAVGRRNILQAFVLLCTQVGFGLFELGAGGLILGLLIGQAAGMLSLFAGSQLMSPGSRAGWAPQTLRRLLGRFRRMPLIMAPSGLINVLGIQLPVLVIASFYGDAVAGWLGLTQRVLALPVTLLGAAVAQVYLGELIPLWRERRQDVYAFYMRTTRRLCVAAGIISMPVVFIGPWLFALVFGTEWAESGRFAQPLALSLAAQLVAVPMAQTLTAFEMQKQQVAWDVGRLLLVTGATVVCAMTGGSAYAAVWVLSGTSTLAYVSSWLLSRSVSKRLSAPT